MLPQARMTSAHSSVFLSILYFVRCEVTDGAVRLLFSKWLACQLRRTAANRVRMSFIAWVETFTVTKGKNPYERVVSEKKKHIKWCITITYVITISTNYRSRPNTYNQKCQKHTNSIQTPQIKNIFKYGLMDIKLVCCDF